VAVGVTAAAAIVAASVELTPFVPDSSGTIVSGGIERQYDLHVPPSRSDVQAPLVLVLHGGGGQDDAVGMIRDLTRFDALADTEQFVVAYPKAVDNYWNDGRGVRRYRSHAQNVDDVGFITALADRLAAEARVDRRRVYVTGASNGAMMAYRVACERPDRFAGIAAVAGNLPARLSCSPGRPIPVLVMNGTDDRLMPWNGGEVRFGPQRLGEVLSAEDTVARWVALNGCDRAPATDPIPDRAPRDGTRVTRQTYSRCSADTEVELYRVEGGGHTWPGGPQQTAQRIVGRTSRDIDATDVIWNFFSRHQPRM
jgi:polyhydroxybutyrate depolymerase